MKNKALQYYSLLGKNFKILYTENVLIYKIAGQLSGALVKGWFEMPALSSKARVQIPP